MMPMVLIVEDDQSMLSLLRTLLQLEGFIVVPMDPIQRLDEILDAVRRENPNVILLDVNLRHLNGFDLLRRLRATEGLHGVRVLMSSGMDYREKCLQEGADGFLLKPYMPDDLIRMIRGLFSDG